MIRQADTATATNSQICDRPVIRIHGARVHNLRDISVDLPRDALTVITGVSGSGKSSLAFDTLYAEGQRQYIESLSTYARQFLDQLPRPDVDHVEGLEPTLCIDQKPGSNNPRSTVATVTEIYDYLRLLFARGGQPHCPECQQQILQQSPEQIIASLQQFEPGTKLMLLSPLVRGRRGKHQEVFAEILKAGFTRARVNGELYPLDELPELTPSKYHTIEAVIDRIIIREGVEDRLADSARLALRYGKEVLTAVFQLPGAAKWEERLLSARYACPNCELSFEELEPRSFSFNSPYGACPACDGMGRVEQFDGDLIIPNRTQPPSSGAFAAWRGATKKWRDLLRGSVEPFLEKQGASWETPLQNLSAANYTKLLHGSTNFIGLIGLLEAEWEGKCTEKRLEQLTLFRSQLECQSCGGGRLHAAALAVTVGGLNIQQTTALSTDHALEHFQSLQLTGMAAAVAKPLTAEIEKRLRFLNHVGVEYLTLDRPADSLSGGELQRVRLATSIGSGLVGVCYVLDEPSIGLHQRDNDRLIEAIRDLQRAGNTVVVVEHDEAVIRAADWLIDMGPGAGQHGGQVLAVGSPLEVAANPLSVTGRYLSGQIKTGTPRELREPQPDAWLTLRGASLHNLKHVNLEIPLGLLVGITGVSGSGKSSLIVDTLYPALQRQLGLTAPKPGPFDSLQGWEAIDKIIAINQAPIGRSPRSCPATFTGVFDEIRKVFAATREAKQRGFTASRFSFNAAAGRCPQCLGQGLEKIEMNFLSDLFVTCSLCGGKRFNQQTLRVRYKQATIADVLQMSVDEASEFFDKFAKIKRFLDSLRAVGLGYLRLGQSSTTLSGGEAQRLKLATELARPASQQTMYLLDEPTTGLHFEDVGRLIDVLTSLVQRGNTVLVIEHNLDVAKACDWLIDLGPNGGSGGGEILAAGPPAVIAATASSVTGRYLAN